MLEHVEGLRAAAERGDALFGTPDSWVVWNLTGGPDGGVHTTDVTNASRTMLMDLTTLDWDDELLGFFGIPRSMLPTISSSSDPTAFGTTAAPRGGAPVPITGVTTTTLDRDASAMVAARASEMTSPTVRPLPAAASTT